jgi:hypothetical protein
MNYSFLDEFFVAEEIYFELCKLITCHIGWP